MSPTTKFCAVLMTKEKGVAGSREGERGREKRRKGGDGEKEGKGQRVSFDWAVTEGIARPRLEWTH